jgi:endoglucanase
MPEAASAAGVLPFRRGINLGNALEAPSVGAWGVQVKAAYFQAMRDAGFDCVRIPVRFSAYADPKPPYTIQPVFLRVVDYAVNQALNSGLAVILDFHHYDELMVDPNGHAERYLAIWRQLAEHYRAKPPALIFELLNEPSRNMDAETWNGLLHEAVGAIRASNPDRLLVVGGVSFNSPAALESLALPRDENLVAAFHFYQPLEFTHQGAEWVPGAGAWVGATWEGSDAQKKLVDDALGRASAWAAANRVPLLMGEFGAIHSADADSRARWTEYVARAAETRGIGWVYWDFCAEFRAYNCATGAWNEALLKALIPD